MDDDPGAGGGGVAPGLLARCGPGRGRGLPIGRCEADRAVDDIEQLTNWDGRGSLGVGALVTAGVGDDEVLGGRQERIEQELTVFDARVAVADVRVAADDVVTISPCVAGKHPVVKAEKADDPMRHGPHRERACIW